jgi:hypothetical protein
VAAPQAPPITGSFEKLAAPNWNLTSYVSAAVSATGIVCCWFLDPVTPLDGQQPAAA